MNREKTTATLLIAIFMISTMAFIVPVTSSPGHDFTDYTSPSVPDIIVSTTEELEAAVTDGEDETVLVEPGTYSPTHEVCYGSWCFTRYSLLITDADTIVARNAPDSANPSVIDTGIATLQVDGVTIKGFVLNKGLNIWASNCEFSYNMISTSGVGIGLMFGNNNLVTNNLILGSGDPEDAGIHIQGGTGISIIGNTIMGFKNGLHPYYNHGKKGAGIYVYSTSGTVLIEENDIKENSVGVYVASKEGYPSPTNVFIKYNNIEGNDDYGVLNCKVPATRVWNCWDYDDFFPADALVDATLNWWGHASGPSGTFGRTNPDGEEVGKGDSVSDYVLWDPWLPQPVGHTKHKPVPPGKQ